MIKHTAATPANISRSRSKFTRRNRIAINAKLAFEREIEDISKQMSEIILDPNMTFVTGGDHIEIYDMLRKREARLMRSKRGQIRLAVLAERHLLFKVNHATKTRNKSCS